MHVQSNARTLTSAKALHFFSMRFNDTIAFRRMMLDIYRGYRSLLFSHIAVHWSLRPPLISSRTSRLRFLDLIQWRCLVLGNILDGAEILNPERKERITSVHTNAFTSLKIISYNFCLLNFIMLTSVYELFHCLPNFESAFVPSRQKLWRIYLGFHSFSPWIFTCI